MTAQFHGQPTPEHGQIERAIVNRVRRLIEIMRLLEVEQTSRAALAQRFGVSQRLIGDDIRILRLAGVEIQRNRDGYWIDGADMATNAPA